jgi:hypothetical protein
MRRHGCAVWLIQSIAYAFISGSQCLRRVSICSVDVNALPSRPYLAAYDNTLPHELVNLRGEPLDPGHGLSL